MDLKFLEEQREEKKEAMEKIINTAKEEERALTEEEGNAFDELEAGIRDLDSSIEKFNKARELLKEEKPEVEEPEKEEMNEEKRELEEFGKLIKNELVEMRAESGYSKGANGTIIPKTIAKEIIKEAFDMSPILDKAKELHIKGKVSIPYYDSEESDLTVSYVNEFEELTEKTGKFKTKDLEGHLIGALSKLSKTLLNNTDLNVAGFAIELLKDYVRRFVEKEVITGTKKITALTEVENLIEAKEVSLDTLVKLKNQVKQVYRKGAIWVMNNDTLTAIELLKDNNGRSLLNIDPTGEFDGMILGYPVYVSDNMDGVVNGKNAIYFGNFEHLVINTPQELEIQVLQEKYATQNAIGIVGWLEVDAKVQNKQAIAALKINTTKAGA